MKTFTVLDVETANYWEGSICQVGLASYHEDGREMGSYSSLIDPQDYFAGDLIEIHGITPEDVRGQPTLADIECQFFAMLGSTDVVVSHSMFDRRSLLQAFPERKQEILGFTWLDTTRVARRTWDEVKKKGYSLSALADRFGIEFKNHDALEDAVTTAKILFLAMETVEQRLEWWIGRAQQRCTPRGSRPRWEIPTPGEEGFLLGQVVCFTGDCGIVKRELARMAAVQGADVVRKVQKKNGVTVLVSGMQDPARLKDGETESKSYRLAEEQGIEIEPAEFFVETLLEAERNQS